MKKTAEWRQLDGEGLAKQLTESREELFKLRFQHATAQLEKTHRLRQVRKDIARLITLQNEKKRDA
jgi:large subunit ribosomal protein L29